MVLKILLIGIILISAFLSIFRYKSIENFYFITSEEIEKNTKDFTNATDLYNNALSMRDALKYTLDNLQKQLEIDQEKISKNQGDPSPSSIDAALTESDKIAMQREQDKIQQCKDIANRSINEYKKSKKDFNDVNKIYTKTNDEYQGIINKIEDTKKNIDSLKLKMITCN